MPLRLAMLDSQGLHIEALLHLRDLSVVGGSLAGLILTADCRDLCWQERSRGTENIRHIDCVGSNEGGDGGGSFGGRKLRCTSEPGAVTRPLRADLGSPPKE